jgi:hypothetical protein
MATPWVPDREDSQARLCPRTKAYQSRMLVLSPGPRHASLLVHEAKTGYMRQMRTVTQKAPMYKNTGRSLARWARTGAANYAKPG